MEPRWVFLLEFGLVAAESAAFFALGYLLARRRAWARHAAVTAGAVCLCYRILASTFPQRFFVESPALLLTGLITPAGFLLLAGALATPFRRPRQRVLIGVFSVVLTYYVFCDAAYLVVRGPAIARLAGRWDGATMVQSTVFTCGPSAAAALLRAWGVTATEGNVAFAARTSFRGTELPLLAQAVRVLGRAKPLKVRLLSTTFKELGSINRPAILFVSRGRMQHTVTLLKLGDDRLVIADPAYGTRDLTPDEFKADYEWSGRAIVAWRDPAFDRLPNKRPDPTLGE